MRKDDNDTGAIAATKKRIAEAFAVDGKISKADFRVAMRAEVDEARAEQAAAAEERKRKLIAFQKAEAMARWQ